MKRNSLYYLLVIFSIIGLGSWVLYPSGSPGGRTGSPGDSGNNCTACHSGTPQQATDWISTNIPPEGYTPGQTYTITASGDHFGVAKFGFETTAEDASGVKQGTIIITDATQTKLVNANKAITHTIDGTTPFGDTKTWNFDWTAPQAGTGDITFYGAFNAANGNGSTSGDVIYLTSTTVTENAGVGLAESFATEIGLRAFPNPARDYVMLSWENGQYRLKEIRVLSSSGKILEEQKGEIQKIALDQLPVGIYYIQAIFQDGRGAVLPIAKR